MKTPIALLLAAVSTAAAEAPPLPRAWTQYRQVESLEQDFADLRAHGIGLVDSGAATVEAARAALAQARRFGMKYSISLPDITEQGALVRAAGFEPVDALMIGGVYQGKAIDRHLFRFAASPHDILIEPPVYNPVLPYTRGSGGMGAPKAAEPIGHYWPEMPPPARAEVIVPVRAFDGRQHLRIVPAVAVPAAPGDRLERDTAAGLPDCPEIRERRLYRVRFDLSGLEGAMLDRVGIAVYWPYRGTGQYWLFGKGTVAGAASSTREALRAVVRQRLAIWSEANGGRFPDEVIAARFGDECFYLTGHTSPAAPAVSYPLWDYSAAGIARFRASAGAIEHPRTWGFPEIYGADAYAWWMHSLHESSAELAGIVREEARRIAPGLRIFRNTTRGGAFALGNDRDGSGPELLTRQLDIVHLDPYPVSGSGYSPVIPRDMAYYGGLARRYGKPLIPWLQAHIYSIGKESLQHVTPQHVDRMAREHLDAGVDGIVWLGYCPGCTFPKTSPESWERATALHRRLAEPAEKPRVRLAVLRGYRAWSLSSLSEGQIRNPGDWRLQQWLEVWSVKRGLPYDVFEVPPRLTAVERAQLEAGLRRYRHVVSTEPWPGAWMVGTSEDREAVDPATAAAVQLEMEKQIEARGWFQEPASPEKRP